MKRLELDRVLEAAVILSWPDLMPNSESGLVHVEYDLGTTGEIGFLQVWSSEVRGFWHLVCTYSSSPQKNDIQFENGYSSKRLAEILNSVMSHQDIFQPPPDLGRQGLLQIAPPSEKERIAARVLITEALDRVGSSELALVSA
jgi:hypothetical protein